MAPRRKLIVVSNRGPIEYGRDETGSLFGKRGAGGLVTAVGPLVSQHDVTWIASALTAEDREVARAGPRDESARDGSRYRLRLVAHDPDEYHRYYNVVANPALWFVQHGLWASKHDPGADLLPAWRTGYEPVNRAFAEAVCAELEHEPGAAVFLQDYHLYLVPGLVRERVPKALLTHFVHIPWVGPREWEVLPQEIVRQIHAGLLANDVVGFHTDRWRMAFHESCAALGLDPGNALVTAHPISVDVAEFDALAMSDVVLEQERELLAERPEFLFLRVDRTDPSKNVVRGLEAFELLLARRPDLLGRAVLLALLDPSRQAIPEYVEERARIEAAAARLEARFPGSLRLLIADDFPRSIAAYKQFDVLLVNAVMDGLNLVAKEAPLVNTRAGVVVLSETTGAFEELGEWAIGVDPLDVAQQADALEQALALPVEERRVRAAAIEAQVREHDLRAWVDAQLGDLDRAISMRA